MKIKLSIVFCATFQLLLMSVIFLSEPKAEEKVKTHEHFDDMEVADLNKLLLNSEFPDGCGKVYQEEDRFVSFLESSASLMAAEKGAKSAGVPELFAVLELQKSYQDLQVTRQMDENPISRLIIAQVCQFLKIRARILRPGASELRKISASDADFHEHLARVSHKMLKDSRSLVAQLLEKQRQEKRKLALLKGQAQSIQQAKELGREKVDDLISDVAHEEEEAP